MKTLTQWQEECNYISVVTDKKGNVQEMNFSKDVFVRYCNMQKSAANKSGFYDVETYIQHCIDDLQSN